MALDRLAAMTAFVNVVEQGSFAGAAARMGVSTSAISRQVAELETHLGARLLHRTTRRLSLTESGQAYFERALHLLADFEETEAMVSASTVTPRGTIRMTCSTSFGVPHLSPAIGAFMAQYPDVSFDISTSGRFVDLVEEGLDLAVRIGNLGNPNLIARRLGGMRLTVCASPAYLAKHGTPATPADLARHDCFTYEYAAVRGLWRLIDADGVETQVKVSGRAHADSGEMLAALAVAGAGIAIEPDFVVDGLVREGRLVPLLTGWRSPVHGIYAVYPSRRHLSAKVRTFVEWMAAYFAGIAPLQQD